MRVLALLALTISAAAAIPSSSQRIVGGTITDISQYPSIAALLYTRDGLIYTQNCGGTIINARNILTAAHCLIGDVPAQWRTRVGSTWANSGGVVHNTELFRLHPQYNQDALYNNDIAIIRTATSIVFNNNVRAGSIAGSNYNLADNQVVWAAGWGSISMGSAFSPQLRHVQIWTINQNACAQRYGFGSITDKMLCSGWLDVGGRDQCQGDSGGPLYHNNVVVGVCSFGAGCADPYYPGVNARVSRYTTWIQANVPL